MSDRTFNSECYGGYEDETMFALDDPSGYRSWSAAWDRADGLPPDNPATRPVVPSEPPRFAEGSVARLVASGVLGRLGRPYGAAGQWAYAFDFLTWGRCYVAEDALTPASAPQGASANPGE